MRRSTRFQGRQQQDSHELLRHLMDRIREEQKAMQTGALINHDLLAAASYFN